MCGRYTLSAPADALVEHFGLESALELPPRYNIAPSQEVPMIVARPDGRRAAGLARWGLEPHRPRDGRRQAYINARAETVAQRPAFRESFERRRCLVPADGFYEWRRANGKQPYFFQLRSGRPFAFAGLWARGADRAPTFAILTTRPNELVAAVHERMPAILAPDHYDLWLGRRPPTREELAELCRPSDPVEMEFWPVPRTVNSPANDSPACRERLPTA